PTGNVLTNDTDVDSGDTKTVSGVASGAVGSASSNVGTVVVGSYGSITITSAGAYTYTVENSNATVQALRSTGNTLTDVFTYTMQDTVGLASTSQITVTVQGANDAPVAFADTATAVESGGVANGSAGTNPTGNVLTNDTDVDLGDTKTVSGVASGTVGSASSNVGTAVVGSYGSITISSTGAYSYTVDNSNATVQALRTTSNTISDVFTYTVTDAGGLSSTTQITVTIQGANDAPAAVSDASFATSVLYAMPSVEYLVVGGGGGGGGGALAANNGGGGGGGGVITGISNNLSAATYSIVVGAGGNGGTASNIGTSGGNSSFNGLVAIGGGAGGGGTPATKYAALSGGSGGGGGYSGLTSGASGT
ncbi:MAG: VCBS domain-containing protein, partial [Pirellula sp.]